MAYADRKKEAIAVAKRAVEKDNAGDYTDAIKLYSRSVELLMGTVDVGRGSISAAESTAVRSKINEYLTRAEQLRSYVDTGGDLTALPSAPSGRSAARPRPAAAPVAMDPIAVYSAAGDAYNKGTTAVANAGGASTLAGSAATGAGVGLLVGGPVGAVIGGAVGAYSATRSDTVGTVARKTGEAAVGAAKKAKDLNDEHQITHKAGEAIKAGYTRAKELNEEHQITHKAGEAIKAGYARAKAIDEEYKVHERVVSTAKAGYNKAVELNDKYQVTTKVGQALSAGLDKITAALAPAPAPAAGSDSGRPETSE